MTSKNPKIVLLGGGTGSFTLLQKLKELTTNITAIVNMCDDGGSTGVLRDELGVLPPGDIRQCLVALSDSEEVRKLFSYRFGDGRFEGQSLGNIILSGLELQHGSFTEAIKVAADILHITGKVIPISLNNHTLVMKDGDHNIYGESKIGEHHISGPEVILSLNPLATINPEAEKAILEADLVVIAPGNLYCSILPIFVVAGSCEALTKTKAKKVCVTNLVNIAGQTDNWHVVDYVKAIESYLGEGQIDTVLYNNEDIDNDLLIKYAAEGEFPVESQPARFSEISAESIGSSFVADKIMVQDPNDKIIRRTLIRHDAEEVARHLINLFGS